MRKVFTYSKKRPYSNVKNSPTSSTDEIENENGSFNGNNNKSNSNQKHTISVSSLLQDSTSGTPQTKRHKDIKSLLSNIDSKLNFLALNEKIDFSKFYRHKNIILSEARIQEKVATLEDLLELLEQPAVIAFDQWFQYKKKTIGKVQKLSEATFSEVFKFFDLNHTDEVVKIIPLELEPPPSKIFEDDIYPLPININAAIHESTVLSEISKLGDFRLTSDPPGWTGFNNGLEISIVKGMYPDELVSIWKKWDTTNGSENSSPGEQHFLVISLEDGGLDLETFQFKNMNQINSVVFQLVYALALAEEKIQFEHRDLHLGNILVKECPFNIFSINGQDQFDFSGLKCSIIDYSLSRLKDNAGIAFRDLDSISWLFEGDSKIDSQYQVYKDMRISKGNSSWEEFHPRSNILWLSFVLERLVSKQKKSICRPKKLYNSLMGLQQRILNYPSVLDLKNNDEFFINHLQSK